jgi:hypothetical protein
VIEGASLTRGEHAGCLTDLDQMAIGITQLAADVPAVILGRGEELRLLERHSW